MFRPMGKSKAARPHPGGRPARAPIRGALLKTTRELRGLSREACAAAICARVQHAKAQSIYQWERGESRPAPPVLDAWCAVLELDPQAARVA